ncbi:MAG TPA: response regulator transcription factor [Verrucomicrobiales bacterium]|jgi:DNA-binding NarL/FixJ family response regulator|nr:response regulator transcription factor [Verrucomicrobiales bacterium]
MTSVSIVEDNARLRRDLSALVEASGECRVLAAYSSAEQAMGDLPLNPPEVVLMDLNLPGANGAQCTAWLKTRCPDVQVLMLTVYEDTDAIFSALQAGANGYLLKRAHPDELLRAIQEVKAGGAPMSSEIARKVVASFQKPPVVSLPPGKDLAALTPREQETLDYLSRGFVAKEVADHLGVSVHTIRVHLKHIYEKLHVRSRTEAVLRWIGEKGQT